MRMVDLIEKKRDGMELSNFELQYIVNGYVNGEIPDYQISAFLMATYFKSMTEEEATNLALAMRDSGDVLDLSAINGVKVDKHSTGGVGDKTSLVLGPIMAALGVKFAKMSGRGLGHTGGTIDKLEAIPGYDVSIPVEQFINQVKNINIALVGQSGNLTPADKKIYALRDVTGTVPSIPLIASSIMSKKLASGADAICLDVKVGSGAFMKTIDDAKKLARLMVDIGRLAGKKMTALLTNMEEPLGFAVGNSIEVIEAIETLKGNGPKDLEELCIEIAAYLLIDAGKATDVNKAKSMAKETIESGKALDKLKELVAAQGGDISYIDDTTKFRMAKYVTEVKAAEAGYIKGVDALMIGHSAMLLGAGRETLTDTINPAVGVKLVKKVSDYVESDDTIAIIYSDNEDYQESYDLIENAYEISKEKVQRKLILDIIR